MLFSLILIRFISTMLQPINHIFFKIWIYNTQKSNNTSNKQHSTNYIFLFMRVQKYAFNISNISCCSLPVFCRLCKWFKINCQNQTTWCVTVLSLTKKNQRQIDHSPIKSRVCLVPSHLLTYTTSKKWIHWIVCASYIIPTNIL